MKKTAMTAFCFVLFYVCFILCLFLFFVCGHFGLPFFLFHFGFVCVCVFFLVIMYFLSLSFCFLAFPSKFNELVLNIFVGFFFETENDVLTSIHILIVEWC